MAQRNDFVGDDGFEDVGGVIDEVAGAKVDDVGGDRWLDILYFHAYANGIHKYLISRVCECCVISWYHLSYLFNNLNFKLWQRFLSITWEL